MPRRLMCQVPDKAVTYLVAFEGDPKPHILREKYLLPAPGELPATITFLPEA